MRTVVVIAGATATGKTGLGEELAESLGGEVVCADSRQLYRELEIGTGKPDPAQRAARPHHLFDALSLGERPTAGAYARLARGVIGAILARGRLPVLVGGSGLYLRATLEGLNEEPPHDAALRAELEREFRELGGAAMHERLAGVDPAAAGRIEPRDRQRVLRALEVHGASGRPLTWWHGHSPRVALDVEARVLELTAPPRLLADRIEERTAALFASGLLEETRALLAGGLGGALRELRAIGYDEALALAEGRLDPAGAREQTSRRTRQLAKRQRTWFRHQLEAVRWDLETQGSPDAAAVRGRLGL